MTIKALAFDLDGTLVEMKEFHKLALNDALRELCNYEIPDELHYKILDGLPTKSKLEYLAKQGLIPFSNHANINKLKQEYTEKYIKFLEPNNIIITMLENIDLPKCVVTNSIRKTAVTTLKKSKIYTLFDFILSNEDVSYPKPSPLGYLMAASRFSVNPNEMLVIEDNEKGIIAAQEAGCPVWQVSSPSDLDIWAIQAKIEEYNNG